MMYWKCKCNMTLLRYTGSKAQLADIIAEMIGTPDVYVEPFLGAAHVALKVKARRMYLSDLNRFVVAFWRGVRAWPDAVHEAIPRFAEQDFYELRHDANLAEADALQASRVHVLQARCHNGVMRVNSLGDYNVPLGHRTVPVYASLEAFQAAAAHLANAVILHTTWQNNLLMVTPGMTVYADPPYHGQHSAYTARGFTPADQAALASRLQELAATGARVLVSNADHPDCDRWYEGFKKTLLYPHRSVGGKRGAKAEALWTKNV